MDKNHRSKWTNEFRSLGITTGGIVAPFVVGGNMENVAYGGTVGSNMYVTIKNLSTHQQNITGYLTVLQLEA